MPARQVRDSSSCTTFALAVAADKAYEVGEIEDRDRSPNMNTEDRDRDWEKRQRAGYLRSPEEIEIHAPRGSPGQSNETLLASGSSRNDEEGRFEGAA